MSSKQIKKTLEKKETAEQAHGFKLYQGGVVPGNSLRVVNIDDTDVEACCGTHCDSTGEVGWIKILATKRIADGIVRMYFVAGEKSLFEQRRENQIIKDLSALWSVDKFAILKTAQKFFKNQKVMAKVISSNQMQVLQLQIKNLL